MSLPKHITNEQTGISYTLHGDFNIPNLILPPEESNIKLGKWGMLHKEYLLKHKKVVFTTLLAEGKLWQYLSDVDTQAQQMFDTLVSQMKEAEGVTEKLKEENQIEWVRRVQNIEARAREVVCSRLIYIQ